MTTNLKIPFNGDYRLMMDFVRFYREESKHQVEMGALQDKVNGSQGIFAPGTLAKLQEAYGNSEHNIAVKIRHLLDSYANEQLLVNSIGSQLVTDTIKEAKASADATEMKKEPAKKQAPMAIVYDDKEMQKAKDAKINKADTNKLLELYSIKGAGTVIEGDITDEDRKNPEIIVETKDLYEKGKVTGETVEIRKRNLSGKEKAVKLYKELLGVVGINVGNFKDTEFTRLLNSFINRSRDLMAKQAGKDMRKTYSDLKLPLNRNSVQASMVLENILALKGNYFDENDDFNFDIITGVKDCMSPKSKIKSDDLVRMKAIQFTRKGQFAEGVQLVLDSIKSIPSEYVAQMYVSKLAAKDMFPFIELENAIVMLIEQGVAKNKNHLEYQDIAVELIKAYSAKKVDKDTTYWKDEKIVDMINTCIERVNARIPADKDGNRENLHSLVKGGSIAGYNSLKVTSMSDQVKAEEREELRSKLNEKKKQDENKTNTSATDIKSKDVKSEDVDKGKEVEKTEPAQPAETKTDDKGSEKSESDSKETVVTPEKDADKSEDTKSDDKVETPKETEADKSDDSVPGGDSKGKDTEGNKPKVVGSINVLKVVYSKEDDKAVLVCKIPGTAFEAKQKFKPKDFKDDGGMSEKLQTSIKKNIGGKFKGYMSNISQSGQKVPEGFEDFKIGDSYTISIAPVAKAS